MTKKLKEAGKYFYHPRRAMHLVSLKFLKATFPQALSHYPSFPFQVTVFLLNRCNLQCPYCSFFGQARLWTDAPPSYLSPSSFQNLLAGLGSRKVELILTGGEPLLHPHLAAILDLLRKTKHFPILFTNGLLLSKFSSLLPESIKRICLSLDGPDKNFHDLLRSRTFDTILASLKEFYSKAKPAPELYIHATLHPKNQESLFSFPQLARHLLKEKIPLAHVQFQHLFSAPLSWKEKQQELYQKFFHFQPATSTLPFYQNGKMDLPLLIRAQAFVKKKMPVSCSFFPDLKPEELHTFYQTEEIPERYKHICSAPHTQLVVLPNGDLQLCPDYTLGNLNQHNLQSLFTSEKWVKLKRLLASGKLFPFCKTCCHLYKW